MIISFILGVLRKPWWWILFVIAAGMVFDVYRGLSNYEWHQSIGREPYNLDIFLVGSVITFVLNYIVYGVGILARMIWLAITNSSGVETKQLDNQQENARSSDVADNRYREG